MTFILKAHSFRSIIGVQHRRPYCSRASNLNSLLLNMPKERTHVPGAQVQRQKIKERLAKYAPGKVMLQVLGSGAEGAPRCLYVFSDQSRYLFNCGEGTQRLAHEHKMKLSRLEHIFFTQQVWKNVGGLPGTALTIQDVGVPEITLHGPKGLEELFRATRRFVVMKNLKINVPDCEKGGEFDDSVMTVKYVPLHKKEKIDAPEEVCIVMDENDKASETSDSLSKKLVDMATNTEKTKNCRIRSRSRSKSPNSPTSTSSEYSGRSDNRSNSPDLLSRTDSLTSAEARLSMLATKEQSTVMAYVCRLKPRKGALNLDKCVKLGVPPGPMLGLLKSGVSVTLTNGTTVHTEQVCEPDDPGPVFLVIDCPSEDYLDSLVTNEALSRHASTAEHDDNIAYIVIHFSPREIVNNVRYREWIESFSPSTQHIVLNDANYCCGSAAVHRIQHQLNMLCPQMFPLLAENGGDLQDRANSTDALYGHYKYIKQTETLCSFHLRPKRGYDDTLKLTINPKEYIEEALTNEGFEEQLEYLKKVLVVQRDKLEIRPYPKILFLGTGSCIPNKTRNTSGILLQTSENSNILMDCGEGTYGQIVRFFGEARTKEVLANTSAVYISHLHADHHIGLIGLLQGRRKALSDLGIEHTPVLLLAPKQILPWLSFYDACFEDIAAEFALISNQDLLSNSASEQLKEETCGRLQLTNLSTCYVKHCPNAFGVSLVHEEGYKITYSGDTMPCDGLVEIGRNSDLLIHEATMEDELDNEAVVKMHSTTSQAIAVGRRMQAKYTLLTHFSQRYAKLPRFNENFTNNVGIAFDNMQICLDELPLLHFLYPSLKILFTEHYEELEAKSLKRMLKREREGSLERPPLKRSA